MRTTHRNAAVVAVALLLAGGLAACNSDAGSASSTPAASGEAIELNYSPPVAGALPFLPVDVAVAKGYFDDENIAVTVQQTSAQALPAALSGGQIDMSADVVYNVARYLGSGVEVKYVSGLDDSVDFTLVRAIGADVPDPTSGEDGWKASFAALEGKSIGVAAKAGPIGLTVSELMRQAGVADGDYTLVDTPGAAAGNALAAGQVTAVLSGGGFDAPLIENDLGERVLSLGKDVPAFADQTNAAVFLSAAALTAHPDAGGRIQKAIAAAVDYIKDPANIDEVAKIAVDSGTPDTSELKDRITGYEYDSGLSLSGLEAGFVWAQTAGITTEQIEVDSTIAEGVESD
ncbi:ABC transporter substrate-binding protein [Herbiconiux liukaitaii]|uniref:ABC transporter substrate-binding protein n=1 Tax=Herbiconiux liukaitaii TaxID=3342799 RepID=UPI0035B7826F